ncbi:MAG TPA: hypothetical protein VKH64_15205 [Candidatus Binatia bacterium]|nr:hypothetical protein [Candidatus Binatia bacterium]
MLLLASGCASTSVSPADAVTDVTIFYLPFETEASPPVTIDTVENYKGSCRFTIQARVKESESLRRTLHAASRGSFDNNQVRVKAVGLLDQEVFIDKKGGVLFGRGGRERQLLGDGLHSVQRTISALAKKRCQAAKPTIGGQADPSP